MSESCSHILGEENRGILCVAQRGQNIQSSTFCLGPTLSAIYFDFFEHRSVNKAGGNGKEFKSKEEQKSRREYGEQILFS